MSDESIDSPGTTDDISDEILAQVTDYVEGKLPAAARAEVEKKIADDATWKRAHAEAIEARDAISAPMLSLQRAKAHAQPTFEQDVTDLIHKRSAGAFFSRRTFGDRVPFGAILVLALLALAVIGYVMYSSSTGSLKRDLPAPPAPPSQPIAPRL